MHNNTKRVITQQQVAWLVWFLGLLAQLVLYVASFSRWEAATARNPIVQLPRLTAGVLDGGGLMFWSLSVFLLFLPMPRWLKWFGSLASLVVALWTVYRNLHAWGV